MCAPPGRSRQSPLDRGAVRPDCRMAVRMHAVLLKCTQLDGHDPKAQGPAGYCVKVATHLQECQHNGRRFRKARPPMRKVAIARQWWFPVPSDKIDLVCALMAGAAAGAGGGEVLAVRGD